MVLLEFFRKKEHKIEVHNARLPDPCGPIGQEVGKVPTEEANKEVAPLLVGSSSRRPRRNHT